MKGMAAGAGRLALAAVMAITLLAVGTFAQQATTAPDTGGGGRLIITTPLAPAPSLSTTTAPPGATLTPTVPPASSLPPNGASGAGNGASGSGSTAVGPPVTAAAGAVLRALDRVSGAVEDIPISTGETRRYGSLDITLGDCRYPTDNPASDAYAFLTITRASSGKVIFRGWMIASSPALDALDHPRYDVWVLHCQLPAKPSSGG